MPTAVVIPEMGYGMVEATITEWLVQVGGQVRAGEPILTMETDKVNTEVLSPATGTLVSIDAPAGAVVAPNQVVGQILAEDEQPAAQPSAPAPAPEAAPAPAAEAAPASAGGRAPGEPIQAAPVARQLAKEHGVDLAQVVGTGPGGRITKADVLRFVEERAAAAAAPSAPAAPAPAPAPAPAAPAPAPVAAAPAAPAAQPSGADDEDEVIPLAGVRRAIAERLSLSKRTAADVTTVAEVDMTALKRFREQVPASYNAFVIRAAALALGSFPIVNSTLVDDRIIIKKARNIGVAVAGPQGLVVPVIRNADRKSLAELTEEIKDLGARAARGALTLQDFADGTFTVSNSGAFGSLMFTPIINHPQTAILGIGKVFEAPIVRNQTLSLGWMMYMCLTYDHRVLDGAPAVQFLQEIKRYLERPWLLAEQPEGVAQ